MSDCKVSKNNAGRSLCRKGDGGSSHDLKVESFCTALEKCFAGFTDSLHSGWGYPNRFAANRL